jgi:hypothetical protein
VESRVDQDWKTTITTRGRMRLRGDLLELAASNAAIPDAADIFRRAVLPLPVPFGFKRDDVTILAREDGNELMWSCTDNEKVLNLRSNAILTRIKGQYSSGSDIDFKDVKSAIRGAAQPNWAGAIAASAASFLAGPAFGFPIGAAASHVVNMVPNVKNAFQFRAYGAPGADRGLMLTALLNLALDRFSPQGNFLANFGKAGAGPILVSLYATASADTDDLWVELRGEILGVPQRFQGVAWNLQQFTNVMNLSNDVKDIAGYGTGSGTTWSGDPASNPNPPKDGTSRGRYVGTLLEQKLKGDFAAPPSNAPSAEPDGHADDSQPFE